MLRASRDEAESAGSKARRRFKKHAPREQMLSTERRPRRPGSGLRRRAVWGAPTTSATSRLPLSSPRCKVDQRQCAHPVSGVRRTVARAPRNSWVRAENRFSWIRDGRYLVESLTISTRPVIAAEERATSMRLASSSALAWVTSSLVGPRFRRRRLWLVELFRQWWSGRGGRRWRIVGRWHHVVPHRRRMLGGKVCSGAGTRSIKSLQSDCASQCTTGCSSPDIPASDRQSCIDACTQLCATLGSSISTAGFSRVRRRRFFTTTGAGGSGEPTTSRAQACRGSPTGICVAATGTTGTGSGAGGGGGAGGGWE